MEQTEKTLRNDFDKQAIAQAAEQQKNAPQPPQTRRKSGRGTKRQSPSLYIILVFTDTGQPKVFFSDRKPNPYSFAYGTTGERLVFKLNNWNASSNFADALFDGRFYNDLKDKAFELCAEEEDV